MDDLLHDPSFTVSFLLGSPKYTHAESENLQMQGVGEN